MMDIKLPEGPISFPLFGLVKVLTNRINRGYLVDH